MKTAALVLTFVAGLHAQQPRIGNAKLETRPGANLPAQVRALAAAQESPAWVAYTVPKAGRGESCCWNNNGRGCGLEGQSNLQPPAAGGPVLLESSKELIVLYRLEHRAIDKVRAFSADCELDAAGLPVYLLTGVAPAESVALLQSLIAQQGDHALSALAMHSDPAAVPVLIDAAKNDKTPRVRGQALFWLAQKAGSKEVITQAIENDPDTQVKKKAVFALRQLPKDEGIPLLIQVARTNKNAAVRKQAIFWLGQSKDPRAVSFFEEVLTR